MRALLTVPLCSIALAACSSVRSQPDANRSAAEGLAVSWGVRNNLLQGERGFRSELTLSNDGPGTLGRTGWALYFNFVRPIDGESLPPSVRVRRIDGDFYELTPTAQFAPLAPGERVSVPMKAAHWAIKATDAPTGFYVVFSGEGDEQTVAVPTLHTEPFETVAHLSRGAGDALPVPTATSRFADNETLGVLPAQTVGPIVPTPVQVTRGDGTWTLTGSSAVQYEPGLESEARYLADALAPLLGVRLRTAVGVEATPGGVVLRQSSARASEGYRLSVDPARGVVIEGNGAAGVFYGIQSLRALLPAEAYREAQGEILVPVVTVEDAPRFGYRGMHLDVARNFQPTASVERLLELMAFYKLNRFHFHLTDDEGWRLAIAPLPELTDVGGRRGHTLDEQTHLVPAFGSGPDPEASPGSGHYTRDEFVALLRYAHARHIEVIPEIDVPGHARAAVKAMEARYTRLVAAGNEAGAWAHRLADPEDTSEYLSVQRWDDNVVNVCQASTYRFLEVVVDEIASMYAEAGVPLATVHVGGDEVPRGVWVRSPACAALIESGAVEGLADLPSYFLHRVVDLLDARGLATAGWEEVALQPAPGGSGRKEPDTTFVGRGVVPTVWNSVRGWGAEDVGYQLANAGYEVVLSNASNLYFDLAHDKDPEEPGYYWAGFVSTRQPYEFVPLDLFQTGTVNAMGSPIAPDASAGRVRLTDTGRANVLGIQGQLWSETVKTSERLEYMVVPRLLSLAERAWARDPPWALVEDPEERERQLDVAWNEFANRLGQQELPRLDGLLGGVAYRLPPPGASIKEGVLRANVEFPGLSIRYTTDGTDPTAASPLYTGPAPVTGTVRLRTFDTRGRGSRTIHVDGP